MSRVSLSLVLSSALVWISRSQSSVIRTDPFCIIGREGVNNDIDGEYLYRGDYNGYPYYESCCELDGTQYIYKANDFYYVVSSELNGYPSNFIAYCLAFELDSGSDAGESFSVEMCDGNWRLCAEGNHVDDANFIDDCPANARVMSGYCADLQQQNCTTAEWLDYTPAPQLCINHSEVITKFNHAYKYAGCDEGFPYWQHTFYDDVFIHFDWGFGAYIMGPNLTDVSFWGVCFDDNFFECSSKIYMLDATTNAIYLDTNATVTDCIHYNETAQHVTPAPVEACETTESLCFYGHQLDTVNSVINGEYYYRGCYDGLPYYEHCCLAEFQFYLYYNASMNVYLIGPEMGSMVVYSACFIKNKDVSAYNSGVDIIRECGSENLWYTYNGSAFAEEMGSESDTCKVIKASTDCDASASCVGISNLGYYTTPSLNQNYAYAGCINGFAAYSSSNGLTIYFDWNFMGYYIRYTADVSPNATHSGSLSDPFAQCAQYNVFDCAQWEIFTAEGQTQTESGVGVSQCTLTPTLRPTPKPTERPTPKPTFIPTLRPTARPTREGGNVDYSTTGVVIGGHPNEAQSVGKMVLIVLSVVICLVLLMGGAYAVYILVGRWKMRDAVRISASDEYEDFEGEDAIDADTYLADTHTAAKPGLKEKIRSKAKRKGYQPFSATGFATLTESVPNDNDDNDDDEMPH